MKGVQCIRDMTTLVAAVVLALTTRPVSQLLRGRERLQQLQLHGLTPNSGFGKAPLTGNQPVRCVEQVHSAHSCETSPVLPLA